MATDNPFGNGSESPQFLWDSEKRSFFSPTTESRSNLFQGRYIAPKNVCNNVPVEGLLADQESKWGKTPGRNCSSHHSTLSRLRERGFPSELVRRNHCEMCDPTSPRT